jgi:hypothetical protein
MARDFIEIKEVLALLDEHFTGIPVTLLPKAIKIFKGEVAVMGVPAKDERPVIARLEEKQEQLILTPTMGAPKREKCPKCNSSRIHLTELYHHCNDCNNDWRDDELANLYKKRKKSDENVLKGWN